MTEIQIPLQSHDERPDWDNQWLNVVEKFALRGTCPRLQVGAGLVYKNMILALAYNGAPAGFPHCTDVGCRMIGGRCKRAFHAEENLLTHLRINLESMGLVLTEEQRKECTVYITHTPCGKCKVIWEAQGFETFKYRYTYENPLYSGETLTIHSEMTITEGA